jgi:hypothetical protein
MRTSAFVSAEVTIGVVAGLTYSTIQSAGTKPSQAASLLLNCLENSNPWDAYHTVKSSTTIYYVDQSDQELQYNN